MTDTIDAYVKATDEASDFVTHQLATIYPQALEDIDDLFRSVDSRDPELWEELEVDAETTVDDYEIAEDRDLAWILGMSGMSAASVTQFTLDNAEHLLWEPLAYKEQLLEPFDLTEKQLIAAGKRGAVKYADDAVTEFKVIQQRFLDDLNVLRQLDTVDLYRTLVQIDAVVPMDKLMADAAGYVSRMTSYRPGSTQWKEAVADLVDYNSKRALTSMTRRSVERIYSYREADGVGSTRMVWVGEGGKNTCLFCVDMFGVVKTYDQWIVDGMPGADVCAGGDLCKCGLAAL
jgi:hypothetical protein